ncbi:MAG TPA: cytochrome c [Pelomicrobium sp.]|nr:cytochrome c [Pelomicrobium sp.]
MRKLGIWVCAAALATSGAGLAAPPSGSAVGPALPPHVRGLLLQEMTAVLEATQAILGGLVRGQDEVVARNAQAIHDSFIMERQMTETDRKALVSAVPQAFLERDRAFHELSARLAAAARAGDKAGQQKLFADMVDACVGCHARHATDRFPGLAGR